MTMSEHQTETEVQGRFPDALTGHHGHAIDYLRNRLGLAVSGRVYLNMAATCRGAKGFLSNSRPYRDEFSRSAVLVAAAGARKIALFFGFAFSAACGLDGRGASSA